MAIVSIGEHWSQRTGSANKEGVREYVKSFLVRVDSAEDGPIKILSDLRIPQKYITTYQTITESDPGARVVEVECRQEGEGYWLWMVVCRYSSDWRDEQRNDPDPLLRPPAKSWGSKPSEEPFEEDLDGEPVVTATREPFDPPVTRRKGNRTLRITMFLPFYNPQVADEYEYSCNEQTFFGYDPGKVLLTSVTGQDHFEGEFTCAQVTFDFEMKKDGWENISVLNQGYMEVNPGNGDLFRPILVNGQPPSRPRLLSEVGAQLDLATEDPVFLSFRAIPKKDFAKLGVPTS